MREWDPPRRSWAMAQTWCDLLFAHWRVPVAELRRAVPSQFELDLFDGEAWMAVVPFQMKGVRLRGLPVLPWVSATAEINVRTYVTFRGKRGVYFFSLHATNRAAVAVAQRFFHLPYFHAAMQVSNAGESVRYAAQRGDTKFRGVYRPSGEVSVAREGTLEYWLTERYCFYTLDRSEQVVRGDVNHGLWPLQPAQASIEANTMAAPFGITLAGAPLLHFSKSIDVVMWMPEPA